MSSRQEIDEKMSGSLKLGLMIIAGVLVVGIVIRFVASLLAFLVPIGILAGVGLIIYSLVSRKALTGGRRRYLP